MNEDYVPDPQFVNLLEWELKSVMRRQGSVDGTSSARRLVKFRLGTTLVLALVSMFVGGAGTYAAIRRTDGQAAALCIARGEALLEIARTQLQHVAQELARTQALVQQGTVTERQLRQIEAQLLQAKSETDIRELELAETLITGKEPNDALSAPLVDGRDFVTERMAARRRPMQRRYELTIDQARRNQELIDAGVASAEELTAAQAQIVWAEEELAGLEKRITLRASFLAGELSAAEVELQDMRFAAIAAREMAVRQVDIGVEQHKRLTLLSERGLVSDSELQAVEADLRRLEAHVELADLELRILDQKLKDASQE
jgi:multidrug resistance efflux pump